MRCAFVYINADVYKAEARVREEHEERVGNARKLLGHVVAKLLKSGDEEEEEEEDMKRKGTHRGR